MIDTTFIHIQTIPIPSFGAASLPVFSALIGSRLRFYPNFGRFIPLLPIT